MLQHEREEFEALLGLFENGNPPAEQETFRTDYGSEDEDFDRDYLEALQASEISRSTPGRPSNVLLESYLLMDMSMD